MLRCSKVTARKSGWRLRKSLLCNLKLYCKNLLRRDAREAEGARLEIVYSANNGIEGSTPSLSAITVLSSEPGVQSC